MDQLKRGWRAIVAGSLLGLLAAGSASSHVAGIEPVLSGQATLRLKTAYQGVERYVQLPNGGQLSLDAKGVGLTWRESASNPKPPRTFPLTVTRINASLTLLPSGRVLVFGGTDASGQLQRGGLWFDPGRGTLEADEKLTLTPRAGHTATVMGDGRVLFVGGVEARPAELWEETANRAVPLDVVAVVPRVGHYARLQNDGRVRLSGGIGISGRSAAGEIVFDPLLGTFQPSGTEPKAAASGIARSLPMQGSVEVAPDGRLSVQFAQDTRMTDLNAANVSLVGPGGATSVRVAPVENGRLVFVQPQQALFPATRYTLLIDRVHGQDGALLPLAAIDFTTAALDAQGRRLPVANDSVVTAGQQRVVTGTSREAPCTQGLTPAPCRSQGLLKAAVWSPGQNNTHNRWRIYGASLEADVSPRIDHLAKLYGLTMVRGRVVRIDEQPVSGVEVSIGSSVAVTDANGRFNLFDVPAGHQELYVDGTTANRGEEQYGQFVVGLQVKARQLNELPYVMHLPKIAARDKIRIASPLSQDMVVGHPDIPGLELHIPKGTVIHDRKGRLVTELAIVPTPVNRAPFPVMENHPMAFTVEPGAAQIRGLSPRAQNGIRLYYPNYDGYTAGTEANFWIYDPTEGWRIYGKGTVSEDGKHVVPEQGVALHQTMGGMYSVPQDNGATESYAPGQSGDCNCEGGEKGADQAANAGDPIDLKTGEFLHSEVDVAIDDVVPLMISRSYRPNDLKRREFGIGTSWNWGYTLNLPNANYNVLELIQPNGTAIRFDRVSGTGNQGEWRQVGSDSRFTGAILKTVYDSDPTQPWGRAFRISMRDGSRLQFSSWNDIRLRWIEDRFGNRTTAVYDAGLMAKLVSPSGRYLNIGYDSSNRIQEVRDHTGRKWSYIYDVNGLLKTVTYPDDKSKHYAYRVRLQSGLVSHHRIESITDARGNRVLLNEFEFVGGMSTGRVVRQVQADGNFIAINYAHNDGATIGTLVTEADGSQRRIVFDAASPYPKSETFAYGTPLAQTFSYERNVYGQLTATVDPLQRRTKFEYNAAGQPTKVTALEGTAKARSMTMEYNTNGDVAATVDSLNRRTQFDYANRCLVKVTDPLGKSVSLACNAAGKPIRIDDALGNSTTLEYDGFELAKVTDAMGHSVRYRYDALGRRISTEDTRGNIARVEYDVMGLVRKSIDPIGRVTEYGYDDNGNLTAVLLPNGNGLTYVYDERDRPKTRTDALNQETTWEYYPGDRVKTIKDRNGQITQFAYDALGRTRVKTYPDGATATSTYDAGDRLRSLIDSSAGDMSWSYDEFDQLKRIDTAQGSIVYDHDGAGRRSEMTVLGQPKVEYGYDNGDRLRRIAQGGEAVLFDYDDLGRPTRTTLPNGIKTDYSYNASHQVTAISWLKPDNTPLGDLNYGYDDRGRLVAQTGSYASQTLAPATAASHTFDDNNRQVSRAGQAQSFDPNGNLTGDGARTYVWNARGQLSRIEQGGVTIGSFHYDPVGRRVSRVEGGETTTYLYDGANAVQETRGGTANSVLTGTRVDQRYARSEASGRAYYLTDHLGSTRALTNASGGVVQRYDYTAYGQDSQAVAGSSNPYLYTGREKDLSGLYFYRARYYDPDVARFISEDSYGLAGGDNFYAYVGGNPMESNDPSGHIIPLLVIAGALWTALEIGLSIYDAVDTYNTVMSPCYSNLRKGIAIGLFAAGLILPGSWGWVDNAVASGARRARHYTDLDGLRGIKKDMAIDWSRRGDVEFPGVHFEMGPPFGPLRNAGADVGAARRVDGVYVEFDLPEGWIATTAGEASGRATGYIPSGATFPISDLNPVFVNAWWARFW
ncbi:RHS repeat-associated core domain-containing protein [Lysobacter gummosus]|uniref:RHS repeat-associated core domain-containing protein n=1 Tax=Lysobacter gummosus TaxID=262324 RepID=UPI00362E115F